MTIRQIIQAIESGEFEHYGLRADRNGVKIGETFDNSRQWWQDYQEDCWGELPDPDDYNSNADHPYNDVIGCWDDGELDGVCTVGIRDASVESVEKALKTVNCYRFGDHKTIYLVGGDYAMGGNDIGELIISNGVAVAKVDD